MEQALPDDVATIWQRVSDEIRASLPDSTYRLWLEPLRPVSVHGTTLYVTGPERVRTWVERRYAHRLEQALRAHSSSLREIGFVSAARDAPSTRDRPGPSAPLQPNPGHTFDRFVIGSGNRLAHGAALAVAELPGDAYNPLFLHGAPGLGKTHLLGAIAHYLRHNHPELTTRYTTGERFTTEFVAALRGAGAEGFKRRHRDIDVLLIDDVQFLEDKARTEEEFFHTFDTLHETGRQIVLASDRAPGGLSLAERLRDRFDWGLSVELASPDLPTRLTVLGRLTGELPVELGEEGGTLREIAARAPANLRQLQGALTRVVALASITSRRASPELAREALEPSAKSGGSDPPGANHRERPSIPAIQDAVCAVLHLSRDDVLSASRAPELTRARHLAMYLTRELTGLSLADIARGFRRDHSTVLHGIRRISNDLRPDSPLHDTLKQTRALLDDQRSPS